MQQSPRYNLYFAKTITYYSPCSRGEYSIYFRYVLFRKKTFLQIYPCPSVLLHRSLPLLTTDGFTHWSLTGTTVTDEDTFMGFSDGLSQSGRTPSDSPFSYTEQERPGGAVHQKCLEMLIADEVGRET